MTAMVFFGSFPIDFFQFLLFFCNTHILFFVGFAPEPVEESNPGIAAWHVEVLRQADIHIAGIEEQGIEGENDQSEEENGSEGDGAQANIPVLLNGEREKDGKQVSKSGEESIAFGAEADIRKPGLDGEGGDPGKKA